MLKNPPFLEIALIAKFEELKLGICISSYDCFGLQPAPTIFIKLKKIPGSVLQRINYLIDNLSQQYQQHSNYREDDIDLRNSSISNLTLRFSYQTYRNSNWSQHKNPILWDRNQFGKHENLPPRVKNNRHNVTGLRKKFRGKRNV